ncbi:MAG: type II toxin-antitoxin system HicB family antitoxin [bacterium]|nr:type II toxin-antitoxin system HicB family antitoxin [bacterium]
MEQKKDLQFYKGLMPNQLTLDIHKTEEGFWAKVKELPHCYTQAKDFFELIEMINDSIYTYLDIPDKFRKLVGFYLPKEMCNEIKKREWESMLKELSKNSNLIEGRATLQMCLN